MPRAEFSPRNASHIFNFIFSNRHTVASGGGLASEGLQDGLETQAKLSEHAHLFCNQAELVPETSAHISHTALVV